MVSASPIARPIRLLIADDHPVVRRGLIAVLDDQDDMEVVAEVSNGRDAIAQFRAVQPDVAILDLRMPEVKGVDAIAAIRAEFPDACIIMLTIYETDEDIYQGLRAGARAYLLKDTPLEEIMEVIRAVCEGKRYVPNRISEKYITHAERPQLSDRERQVLELMATGHNNKTMSAALSITEHTIRFHVANLIDKLGASDRTEAVVIAMRRGFIRF
ncbi:response regulator [Leptolyngbya sp. AN03gr2]|uniref:response regulator n=1 Tax=unclassified Leptolyngbya TaxID=2650499 RepID=UPI003D315ECF